MIEKAVGRAAVVEEQPAQPGDVVCTFADVSQARRDLAYAPSVPVAEGIPRFVEWYRQEENA